MLETSARAGLTNRGLAELGTARQRIVMSDE